MWWAFLFFVSWLITLELFHLDGRSKITSNRKSYLVSWLVPLACCFHDQKCPKLPLASIDSPIHFWHQQCINHFLTYLLWLGLQCFDNVGWASGRASIRPVKIEWWGVGVVTCLEWGADCLRMASWCHCIPKSRHLLPHLNPDWFYLSGTGMFQVVLENRPLNVCSKDYFAFSAVTLLVWR